MGAPVIVAVEPFLKASVQGGQRGLLKKVDSFVFHTPP